MSASAGVLTLRSGRDNSLSGVGLDRADLVANRTVRRAWTLFATRSTGPRLRRTGKERSESLPSGTYGRLTSAEDPRIIQFGLKYQF